MRKYVLGETSSLPRLTQEDIDALVTAISEDVMSSLVKAGLLQFKYDPERGWIFCKTAEGIAVCEQLERDYPRERG